MLHMDQIPGSVISYSLVLILCNWFAYLHINVIPSQIEQLVWILFA